jgi:Flp pilus assembly protein TadG
MRVHRRRPRKDHLLRLNAVRADNGSMVSEVPAKRSGLLRSIRRENGQALVEFALILPLFLLIVVGIIQFALVLNFWFDLNRVANQGARWAVVNQWPVDPDGAGPRLGMAPACSGSLTPSPADCQPTLQEHLKQERLTGGTDPCVNITFPDPDGGVPGSNKEVGDPVQVEVIAAVRFLQMPFVVLPGIYLSGKATMRLEQKPTRYSEGTGDTTC